jgi:rod shape-determining protein MreC
MRPHQIQRSLMGVLLTAVIVTVSLPRSRQTALQFIETSVRAVVHPIQQTTATLMQAADHLFRGYIDLVDAQEENRRLHQAMGRLEEDNHRLRVREASALRLQELLDYREETEVPVIVARVIGRDVVHWFDTVMLDKGAADGVAVDMGVVTPQGVVGVVMKVGRHDSEVLLVTDRRSAVAAVVERTRDAGIVQGLGGGGFLHVKYLPRSAAVAPSDRWVTSGLEGSFVEGIPIGQISVIHPSGNQNQDETALFLNVQVTPAVVFSKLEEVLILTAATPTEAAPAGATDTQQPPPPSPPLPGGE